MAHSVKCPALDLSSDLNLRAPSSGPVLGSTLGVEHTQGGEKKTFP